MKNDIQINAHPFFHGEYGRTERELLLKLTPLCNWDTRVGIIAYLPDAPHLDLGIIDETKIISGQIPCFTQSISIQLSSKEHPLHFKTKCDPEFCKSVLMPLLKNWIAFTEIVLELTDESHSSKKYIMEKIEYWKQYPITEYLPLYLNPHNH